MTPLDDDLLAALRAARPDAGYQPSAASPEATAMLARILGTRRGKAPKVTRRRLLLAGLPVMAGAAATAVLAPGMTSPGPDDAHPTVSSVRTAVLDAFERESGAIVYTTRTIRRPNGPEITQRAWTYPAFPATGQQVRFRLFQFLDGVPDEDTGSIYVENAASGHLTQSTTQGPRVAEIIDVEYATRTWSRQQSSSVLLAGNLSPALIRDQIASGGFTVLGPSSSGGRQAVKITWTRKQGPITATTLLARAAPAAAPAAPGGDGRRPA
jgi:hypothetical protein